MTTHALSFLLVLGLAGPTLAQTTAGRETPSPSVATSRLLSGPGRTVARPTTQDLLQTATRQSWRNSAWQDTSRVRYTAYDGAGHNLEFFKENWSGTTWSAFQRRTQVYNALGQRMSDTIFSGATGNPFSAFRRSYTATGKPDTVAVRFRLGSTWRPFSRETYTDDANDNLVTEVWEGNVGGWSYTDKFSPITDALGRITNEEHQEWDDQAMTWAPLGLTEYTYSAGDSILTFTESQWDANTNGYELFQRERNHYNALDQRDSTYFERYNPATFGYELTDLWTYQYDARGNRTQELRQRGTSLGTQVNRTRYVFTYTPFVGLPEDPLATSALTLAPNPTATGRAELRYELNAAAPVQVKVLDLLGRCVAAPLSAASQAAGAHTFGLDVRNLPAGLYLVRLTAAGVSRQMKLVVE